MKCPTCDQNMELLFVNFHCWNCEKKTSIVTKEVFDALSDKDKRIYLAQDVLRLLETRKIIAEFCVYLRTANTLHKTDLSNAESFSELRAAPQCYGCALGSLFLAGIEKEPFDPEQFPDNGTGTVIANYLTSFFSSHQIWMIETAFEADTIWLIPEITGESEDEHLFRNKEESKTPIKFGLDFTDPTERLIAIMNNIIQHDGEFVP